MLRHGVIVAMLTLMLPPSAAAETRCGRNWSEASGTCGPRCRSKDSECPPGMTCFGSLRACEQSLTSRCGVSWHLASGSCGLVCEWRWQAAQNESCGRVCKTSQDCAGGESCHTGLPTWPCNVTSPTSRCGANQDDASRQCGKVCGGLKRDCPGWEGGLVDCFVGLDDAACWSPPPERFPIMAWVVPTAVVAVAAKVLAIFIIRRQRRVRRQARLVRKASGSRATSESLERRADAIRLRRASSVLAAWLEAAALRVRSQADSLLARAAREVGGGPAHWGMTVAQLVAFRDEHLAGLEAYCCGHWLRSDCVHVCKADPCPHDHGAANFCALEGQLDQALRDLELNMHVVVALRIKPLTRATEGIFGLASLLNEGDPKKVETFVSHCWNEHFTNFVATLEGSLRSETVVWICSFALPQNLAIDKVLGASLKTSPFACALVEADRVLMVVDSNVEPLRRSWCCYEVYLAIVSRIRIDIRAPVVSTDLYRRVLQCVVDLDIRACRSSDMEDHRRIMSAIQGSEDTVNTKIRVAVEEIVSLLESHVP